MIALHQSANWSLSARRYLFFHFWMLHLLKINMKKLNFHFDLFLRSQYAENLHMLLKKY